MERREGYFGGIGSVDLTFQSWREEKKAKAVLAVIHGFGEHCGRYLNVVNHSFPETFAPNFLPWGGEGIRNYPLRAAINFGTAWCKSATSP